MILMTTDYMRRMAIGGMVALVGVFWTFIVSAAPAPPDRHRLYTTPDSAASGGIEGSVAYPTEAIEQVLAIPPDEPRLVYEGTVTGSDRREFQFSGLPMRKYDLIVIYKNRFYEGLQLHREDSTLTKDDLAKINTTIQKCEPFFTAKIIHRIEGTTGRGNLARCICTFVREEASETWLAEASGSGNRRTFKIVMLKQVGPGWQIVRSRDLYPIWATPSISRPTHKYSRELSRVRVSDRIKELSPLHLGR